jgi:hypothetical protein
VTFKVDAALHDALKNIPNRSDFIRRAVVAALEVTCPLCQGTGVMTPGQKQHWDDFATDHRVTECDDCHEIRLICEHGGGRRK